VGESRSRHIRAESSSSETGDELAVNMVPSGGAREQGCSGVPGRTIPVSNGRSERRFAKAVRVEVCLQDEPMLKEVALAENVSAHGVRVLLERKWRPGQRVLISSPKEGVRSQAQIVYCQRVAENRFAVGLELSRRVELWARPY
jgi:hypothetical protein